MKRTISDIDGLFHSFGGDPDNFQELARRTDVAEAERRWPLLSSIAATAAAEIPALSEQQRKAWQEPPPAGLPPASSPPPLPVANQLAAGLLQLGRRGQHSIEPTPVAAEPLPVAPTPTLQKPSPAPLRATAVAPSKPLKAARSLQTPAVTTALPSGKRFSLGLGLPKRLAEKSDDSLASIFARVDRQASTTASGWGGLFSKGKRRK